MLVATILPLLLLLLGGGHHHAVLAQGQETTTASSCNPNPFKHAHAGYVEPPYFQYYEDNIGCEHLKRCVRREDPPVDGESCRPKPKSCIFGSQTCPSGDTTTPGGTLQPNLRCDCRNEIWTCKNFTCPTMDPICPLTKPDLGDGSMMTTTTPMICSTDMHCGYGENVQCCGRTFQKTRCTGQAGQPLTCFEIDCDTLDCTDIDTTIPIITNNPTPTEPTAPDTPAPVSPTSATPAPVSLAPATTPAPVSPTLAPVPATTPAPVAPTDAPVTAAPSVVWSEVPSVAPVVPETPAPSITKSETPSSAPVVNMTPVPSAELSQVPTQESSDSPTETKSQAPSVQRSEAPTAKKDEVPSSSPSEVPSPAPTPRPTLARTSNPTADKSESPTIVISSEPSKAPSEMVQNFRCSNAAESTTIPGDGGAIRIRKTGEARLCTISRVDITGDSNNKNSIKPVARSYTGLDWESSPGPFSTQIDFDCSAGDDFCTTTLPTLHNNNNKTSYYQATTFMAPPRTDADMVARFLEQATFGPTRAELTDFPDASTLTMANWVKTQQQQQQGGMTSHRQLFRQRLNARMEVGTPQGPVTHPCAKGTRYRRFAFSSKDVNKYVDVKRGLGNTRILSVEGFVRTVITGPVIRHRSTSVKFDNGSFLNKRANNPNRLGGPIVWDHPDRNNNQINFDGTYGNPPIEFDAANPPNVLINIPNNRATAVDSVYFPNAREELILTGEVIDAQCSTLLEPGVPINPVFALYRGEYYMHDPRFETISNTMEAPAPDAGGQIVRDTTNVIKPEFAAMCANAPRSFLSDDDCIFSYEKTACNVGTKFYSSQDFDNMPPFYLQITPETARGLWQVTGAGAPGTRYPYAVDGLRVSDDNRVNPPCQRSTKSRWMNITCSGNEEPAGSTLTDIFGTLLGNSRDKNPLLRDVTNRNTCDAVDEELRGFEIKDLNGNCWLHVHPDHMNVYDFEYWTREHPGNAVVAPRNPITEFAEGGNTTLVYPWHHAMNRWWSRKSNFGYLGRLYDEVHFYDLPQELRTSATSEYFGFLASAIEYPDSNGVVVCGSPNEIPNEPSLGGSVGRGAFDSYNRDLKSTTTEEFVKQKRIVWTLAALTAKDQLRQRVAWAIAQILVISQDAIGDGNSVTEDFLHYYDIFVRHAFGNYRDILKEVSYSPMMAEMLSYLGSRSTAYTWRTKSVVAFADENYAREVMQLFSIGLTSMHQDGSPVIGSNGEPQRAYLNDDILEYARVWTGFSRPPWRGNIEFARYNRIDPMTIDMRFRDVLPKMGLNRTYVGDHFPLCADLPDEHFLKRGATYRLLGYYPSPELLIPDPRQWTNQSDYKHLKAEPKGATSLFAKLCGSTSAARCNFATKVVLDENVPCTGEECGVDTIRVIEVTDGIFYEYERQPCVYQAFYNNAVPVVRRESSYDLTCADPRTEVAGVACCDGSSREWNFAYWGERTTFATAEKRCTGVELCSRSRRPSCGGTQFCRNRGHYWTTGTSCALRAKIDKTGNVAIVHNPIGPSFRVSRTNPVVRNDTKTFFRVDWSGNYTTVTGGCSSIDSCELDSDGACQCDIVVSDAAVFSDSLLPSRDEVLISLRIGAFDPIMSGISAPSGSRGNIKWYNKGSGGITSETVFEVVNDAGIIQFRKNVKSTAQIVGSKVSFRNPVHFIDLVEAELRDAHHETDGALDHYVYHPNTAPFLAIRFAQRFGISNPSRRYIKAIATAFQTGSYSHTSEGSTVSFGSGAYGDLAATMACVLLDREAREGMLDVDPAQGSLREPMLKLMGLMRSLELQLSNDEPFLEFDYGMGDKIGQMAHELPNVFSFFLPEFKPPGPISMAGLAGPEGQVLTGPRIIDTLNGYLSLFKYGLSSCYGGVSDYKSYLRESCSSYTAGEFHEDSRGSLAFAPANPNSVSAITDELATLMTAGRLPKDSRDKINRVLAAEPDPLMRVIKAEQLISFTPEFHTTGVSKKNGQVRTVPPPVPPSNKPYKAVVYLQLQGGFDSFNMLAPHTCTQTNPEGKTLLEQYYDERTVLAITAGERSRVIHDSEGRQPCSHFVVHEDLPLVEQLYKAGDLSFFANTGVLEKNVTKENYSLRHNTQLFAHNAMQQEAIRMDPLDTTQGTGILGRMCDVLKSGGFNAQPITIKDSSVATVGVPGVGVEPLIVSPGANSAFNPKPNGESFDPRPFLDELNDATEEQSSLFGENWSKRLQQGLHDNQDLQDALSTAQVVTDFPNGSEGDKLETIASLISSRGQRGKDRDVFFVGIGGWDHHSQMKSNLASRFTTLNAALTAFVDEMKAQQVWNDVTLVMTSDFARTLTANSGDGSDHAWGGNYFLMGGSVNGRKIHGQYPDDITGSGPLHVGRGRLIPTSSWESMLNPVLGWMGVPNKDLEYCMPNRQETGTKLYETTEVFV